MISPIKLLSVYMIASHNIATQVAVVNPEGLNVSTAFPLRSRTMVRALRKRSDVPDTDVKRV